MFFGRTEAIRKFLKSTSEFQSPAWIDQAIALEGIPRSLSSVSSALIKLENRGIVVSKKEGNNRLYKLASHPPVKEKAPEIDSEVKVEIDSESGTGTLSYTKDCPIKIDELLTQFGLVDEWEAAPQKITAWESPMKVEGEYSKQVLYCLRADIHRKPDSLISKIRPARFTVKGGDRPRSIKPKGLETALIIPDSQNGYTRDLRTGVLTPFHDRASWDVALQIAREHQPDRIIFLGDMTDLTDFSIKYLRSPDQMFLAQVTFDELAYTFSLFRSDCPDAKMDLIDGNHDTPRIETLVKAQSPQLYGLRQANKPESPPLLSIRHLLGLDELNIQCSKPYPQGVVWLNPVTQCIHGTKVKQKGGETARAILRDSFGYNTIYGHIHRHELVYQTEYGYRGQITRFAASPGTIATNRTPGVTPTPDWQQGLMWVTYDPNDETGDRTFPEMLRIRNGETLFRGNVYQGNFDVQALAASTDNPAYLGGLAA